MENLARLMHLVNLARLANSVNLAHLAPLRNLEQQERLANLARPRNLEQQEHLAHRIVQQLQLRHWTRLVDHHLEDRETKVHQPVHSAVMNPVNLIPVATSP